MELFHRVECESTVFFQAGIGEILHAIAQDNHTALSGNHQVKQDMSMSEDVIVGMCLLFPFFGKSNEGFLVFSLVFVILLEFFLSVVGRPIQSEAHSP